MPTRCRADSPSDSLAGGASRAAGPTGNPSTWVVLLDQHSAEEEALRHYSSGGSQPKVLPSSVTARQVQPGLQAWLPSGAQLG